MAQESRPEKRACSSVTCFCFLLALLSTDAWGQTPEPQGSTSEIVARVNGEAISRSEFERMAANPLTLQQAQQELGIKSPDRKDLEALAMKRLVRLRLLLQEAARRKITVTQDELDQAITDLRRHFDSLKDFGTWVKEQGLNDPELFQTVRNDMLTDQVKTALTEQVSVSEKEAQQYFEAHRDDLIIGAEVRLRIIAVSTQSEADELMDSVRKGVPFDRLARQRSKGRLAASGGDTGWVNLHALPALLQEAVASLNPGEVRGPVKKAEDQFLIVGLQDRRPVLAKSVDEAQAEIHRRLLPGKQQEFLQAWLEQEEEKSTIERVPPVQATK